VYKHYANTPNPSPPPPPPPPPRPPAVITISSVGYSEVGRYPTAVRNSDGRRTRADGKKTADIQQLETRREKHSERWVVGGGNDDRVHANKRR